MDNEQEFTNPKALDNLLDAIDGTALTQRDKGTIVYNHDITIKDIPLKAQEYVVNKKSALDWLVERCCVSTDKDTGIVNDFNDYARDQGGEKYTFDLVLRVITVSIGTVDIVNALPPLEIHDLDK